MSSFGVFCNFAYLYFRLLLSSGSTFYAVILAPPSKQMLKVSHIQKRSTQRSHTCSALGHMETNKRKRAGQCFSASKLVACLMLRLLSDTIECSFLFYLSIEDVCWSYSCSGKIQYSATCLIRDPQSRLAELCQWRKTSEWMLGPA